MRPRLRLFTGDDQDCATLDTQVSVRLGDITQLLADAAGHKRTWLSDFEDDEVQISTDLYEIIASYSHLRPSA